MELLNSHNSLRFLDVKGRPEGNGRPSPPSSEAEGTSFAATLKGQRLEKDSALRTESAQDEAPALGEALLEQDQALVEEEVLESDDVILVAMDWALNSDSVPLPSIDLEGGVEPVQVLLVGDSAGEGFAPVGGTGLEVPVLQGSDQEVPGQPVGATEVPVLMEATPETVAAEVEAILANLASQAPVKVAPGAANALRESKAEAIDEVPLEGSSAPMVDTDGKETEPSAPEATIEQGDFFAPEDALALPKPRLEGDSRGFDPASLRIESSQVVEAPKTAVQTAVVAPQAQEFARAEAVLGQVHAKIEPGMQRASLRLHPEELGRVSIELSVDRGEVRAELRVESKEALQILQKHVPELRAMFAQADLELSDLQFQLHDGPGGFAWHGEESKQGGQHQQTRSQRAPITSNQPVVKADWTQLSLSSGGLDLLA